MNTPPRPQDRLRARRSTFRRSVVAALMVSAVFAACSPPKDARRNAWLVVSTQVTGANAELRIISEVMMLCFVDGAVEDRIALHSAGIDQIREEEQGERLKLTRPPDSEIILTRGKNKTITFDFENGLSATMSDKQIDSFKRFAADFKAPLRPSVPNLDKDVFFRGGAFFLIGIVMIVFGLLGWSLLRDHRSHELNRPIKRASLPGRILSILGGSVLCLLSVAYVVVRVFRF